MVTTGIGGCDVRCINCYLLAKCPGILVKQLCPKVRSGPKCRNCRIGGEYIVKVIDRRESDTEKTLVLGKIPYNQAFEFIDERKPYHCGTFIKTNVCHTYRRRLRASTSNHVWAFDVVKGKLCQFSMSNEIRMLEAEFHIIGEVNG